jgi:enediyne biosynthesis protein E4
MWSLAETTLTFRNGNLETSENNMKKTRKQSGWTRNLLLAGIFLSILLTGCSNTNTDKNRAAVLPASNDDFFQDIALQSGPDFIHTIGDNELDNIIESVGGGAAFLDYDQDGFIDLFVCNGTWIEGFSKGKKPEQLPGNRLYRNNHNGYFVDVTEKAGLKSKGYGMGITVGDIDNDGYPDMFISNYGPNILYRNNGNGTFSDITAKAGVAGGNECSVGAAWLDYDNDGLLDLYVGNYLFFDPDYKYFYAPDGFPGPMAYDAQKDVLYRNLGNNKFEDVTEAAGIVDIDGRAMGVGAADYDDDGFVDIYVANDHTLNYLWHNNGNGTFSERGIMSGTGFSQSGEATVSMSVDFADFNGDGLLDMFLSDDRYCSLYENMGNGVFNDRSYSSGIATAAGPFVGWSSSFIDYDNDGDKDIYKANGALKHLYGMEDQLFENTGDGQFKDISVKLGSWFHEEMVGRGASFGDYDNDGDLDAYIVNLHDRGALLRNNRGNENNWILLQLTGTTSNRDGIGARVKLTAGGKTQTLQKISTTGYLSQNDPRMHFGIGSSTTIEKIEIKWPSGKIQEIQDTPANQILKITEP